LLLFLVQIDFNFELTLMDTDFFFFP